MERLRQCPRARGIGRFDAEKLRHLTADGDDLTAGYRGDGKRAWKEDSQENRTYYLYDGDRLIAELDDDGAVIATLSWGAAGLFAYGSTQYQFDLQGNVVARTSSIGSVLSTHWYDAHGTEQTTPSTDPFGYKGQWGYYTDRETGLILCTHRYLDPEAGRWLTRDPISYAGGVNLYGYCGSEPVLTADPSGREWYERPPLQAWICTYDYHLCWPSHEWIEFDRPVPIGPNGELADSIGFWPDGLHAPDHNGPQGTQPSEADHRRPVPGWPLIPHLQDAWGSAQWRPGEYHPLRPMKQLDGSPDATVCYAFVEYTLWQAGADEYHRPDPAPPNEPVMGIGPFT